MAGRVILFLLLVLAVTSAEGRREPTSHNGTTPHIEEIFIGRCWDYNSTKYKDLLPRVEVDCNVLWQFFKIGFSYQAPCDVSIRGYEPFLKAARQRLPLDKVMFWSGEYVLAHCVSTLYNYVTLEDTLIGYLANSLIWCGQYTWPGMNLVRCPEWKDCYLEASKSFWAGASTEFAMQATGNVTVMLGASNPTRPAYRNGSIFSTYELPNLQADKVTSVNVLVTHKLGEPLRETCSNGSLLLLRHDVMARGFSYTCEDDQATVLHILCSKDPTAMECRLALAYQWGQLPNPDHSKPLFVSQKPMDRFNT